MKISQEVREFARLNPPRNGEGDHAQHGGGAAPTLVEADAEAGMAQQSQRYREGGDLYMAADDVPHAR